MSDMAVAPELEFAPEPPPKGPRIWLRDNLFSTPMSSVLSAAAILIVIFAIRGLLNFLFDPLRRWDAVTFNMRLLMVQAYPTGEMWRVWLAVAIVAFLLAASIAVWKMGGMLEPRQVSKTLMSIGGFVALSVVVGPFSLIPTLLWIAGAAALTGIGFAIGRLTGERAKEPIIPIMGIIGIVMALIVVVLWVLKVPVPGKIVDGNLITDGAEAAGLRGEQVKVFRPLADSTKIPWTMILAFGALTYLGFKMFASSAAGRIKSILTMAWIAAFPVLVLILLRNPLWDWGKFGSVYIAAIAGFGVVGSLILWFVTRPSTGEIGRVIGGLLVVLAFVSFIFPMPFVFRFLMLALALFTLAGPTFGGESSRSLIIPWVTATILISFFVFTTSADSGIEVPGNFFLGGLSLTIVLAFTSIVLSFPLGVILALGRTSTMPIFRLLSTVYIELVRGVPLITWLLVAFLMLPVALPEGIEVGGVMRAVGAMTFFSAAYLAENVRGGLQSIPGGQREAARALGMSTVQMIVFITLPQALRAVIPALVGQVIALFKDTSLVTIVGLFDFLHMARAVIPAQSQPFSFLGSIKETLIFAAVVYWMFTFTFSRISLRLEKKLGVGER